MNTYHAEEQEKYSAQWLQLQEKEKSTLSLDDSSEEKVADTERTHAKSPDASPYTLSKAANRKTQAQTVMSLPIRETASHSSTDASKEDHLNQATHNQNGDEHQKKADLSSNSKLNTSHDNRIGSQEEELTEPLECAECGMR